jgi:hypothetical protein
MEEYNTLKKEKEEEKKIEKKLRLPLILEGGALVLSADIYLNTERFTRYIIHNPGKYSLDTSVKSVAVIAPIVLGTLLVGCYKEELAKHIHNIGAIPKKEYYLENREVFNSYNEEVDNKNIQGEKINFDNADGYSMSYLQTKHNQTCDYYAEKYLKRK